MEFFTLELWKLGCSFFDRKYENVYFTYQNMVTFSHMKYGIFSYFSFENLHAVFPSWNIEYYLFNIWKKCIHFLTTNVEFFHRFSCLSSEILYISIKKAWMKVFWYETWKSVYFIYDNLGRNILIRNVESLLFTYETFSRFVHMKPICRSGRNS